LFFYYLFLLLAPFQDHPIFGASLINLGFMPLTPVKVAGILMLAYAFLTPPPPDAAPSLPTRMPMLYLFFAVVPVFSTMAFGLPVPQASISALISFGFLLVATRKLITNPTRARNTVRMLVFAETFATLWLYKQYYIQHWPRPIGPSSDPNYEALSIVMVIPLAVWVLRYDENKLWRFIALGCTPVLIFAVFLSQSRGGLLALAVLMVTGWFKGGKKASLLFAGIFLIGLTALLAPSRTWERVRQTKLTGEATSGGEVSSRTRVELIKAGIHMMEKHPVLGIGLERFQPSVFKYNPNLANVISRNHIAHNTYVQIGAECGLPVLAVFLAILLQSLLDYRAIQSLARPGGFELGALGVAMELGLYAYGIAAFFLSAQLVKSIWVYVFLSHNLREIAASDGAKRDADVSPPSIAVRPVGLRRPPSAAA
jgi:O-antigen ligase